MNNGAERIPVRVGESTWGRECCEERQGGKTSGKACGGEGNRTWDAEVVPVTTPVTRAANGPGGGKRNGSC